MVASFTNESSDPDSPLPLISEQENIEQYNTSERGDKRFEETKDQDKEEVSLLKVANITSETSNPDSSLPFISDQGNVEQYTVNPRH